MWLSQIKIEIEGRSWISSPSYRWIFHEILDSTNKVPLRKSFKFHEHDAVKLTSSFLLKRTSNEAVIILNTHDFSTIKIDIKIFVLISAFKI